MYSITVMPSSLDIFVQMRVECGGGVLLTCHVV